ncbi:uncharacterized protein LOC9658584 [Selaginella moellendorffii]|uniref:uncharacterized protein LOC9658584 n=1 Tax=Selaginella moellendorffii TaxID=88036 RepID=UPI000D1CDD2C|nr:uncharacterized protein LOC9658584 [Selaginella moellendorffii]|eukprot:XP_024529596.1 uncharacterized protein LOC9658584 [Selaginella moellendorffii]
MPSVMGGGSGSGENESPIRSGGRPPRTFSLSNLISELVGSSSSKSQQQQQQQPPAAPPIRRMWSAGDVEGLTRCPYSAVVKNPGVPFEFQMPVHYPRFTRQQYATMPEWQIDRLLEEYGLPAHDMGGVEDKRQYAIGAFLWKEQQS